VGRQQEGGYGHRGPGRPGFEKVGAGGQSEVVFREKLPATKKKRGAHRIIGRGGGGELSGPFL